MEVFFYWDDFADNCAVRLNGDPSSLVTIGGSPYVADAAFTFDMSIASAESDCVFGPNWPPDLVDRLATRAWRFGVTEQASPQALSAFGAYYPGQVFGGIMAGDLGGAISPSGADITLAALGEAGTPPTVSGSFDEVTDMFTPAGEAQSGVYVLVSSTYQLSTLLGAL